MPTATTESSARAAFFSAPCPLSPEVLYRFCMESHPRRKMRGRGDNEQHNRNKVTIAFVTAASVADTDGGGNPPDWMAVPALQTR